MEYWNERKAAASLAERLAAVRERIARAAGGRAAIRPKSPCWR